MNVVRDVHVEELLPSFVNGTLSASETDAVRGHVEICVVCAGSLEEWQAVGATAQVVSSAAPMPSRGLLARAWTEINNEERAAVAPRRQGVMDWLRTAFRPGRNAPTVSLGAGLAAVVMAAAIVFTPLGAVAQGVLHVFQPKQFVAAPVTMQDLDRLEELEDYGTFNVSQGQPPQQATSRADAAAKSRMAILAPSSLPSGVPNTPTFMVMPPQSASFTFSAAKLQAAQPNAAPMPASINGSTLDLATGFAVVTAYGGNFLTGFDSGPGSATAPNGQKALIVAQAKAPTVSSTGASADQLKQYLLSQPGISPALAEAVKSIGDPSATWPIPIPIGYAGAHAVTIRGAQGLAIADSTGLGGGLLWIENGTIYAVAGTLTEKELVTVAQSLQP